MFSRLFFNLKIKMMPSVLFCFKNVLMSSNWLWRATENIGVETEGKIFTSTPIGWNSQGENSRSMKDSQIKQKFRDGEIAWIVNEQPFLDYLVCKFIAALFCFAKGRLELEGTFSLCYGFIFRELQIWLYTYINRCCYGFYLPNTKLYCFGSLMNMAGRLLPVEMCTALSMKKKHQSN